MWKFGDDINTDLMLPGAVMSKTEAEQARAVFAANRPGWIDQMKPGDVHRRGTQFRHGLEPARRRARCGISASVSCSPNRSMACSSATASISASSQLECPGCFAAFEEGDTAELDLDRWKVGNPRTGATLAPPPVPDQLMSLMRGGGIYPMLERQGLIAPRA